MSTRRVITFRPIAGLFLASVLGAPAVLDAQACLGLHASGAAPTLEVVGNFHRDGLQSPSSVGLAVTDGGRLFGVVETGADPGAGKSVLALNGFGVAGGVLQRLGAATLCAGGQIARGEQAGVMPTSAEALFAAGAVPVAKVLGVSVSAFGVAALESRTSRPAGLPAATTSGLALRAGLAASPRPWLGLRLYEDRADGNHRVGFSVGLSRAFAPKDSDGDGVIDAADRCPNTPAGTPVTADGCPKDSDGDGVIDANDRCPNTPAGTPVTADGCPKDSDGDGVIDAADRCPNTPAGTPVTADGCPKDSDGDGVIDADDRCPNTPAGTAVDARGCPQLFAPGASFELTGVTFETSSAVIRPIWYSYAKLDSVAAALVANPEVRVEIAGHTDNVGSDVSNQRLSRARAEAVKRYFVSKGVAADRMEARGFGESRPITTNDTAAGRAANRRVEMRRLP